MGKLALMSILPHASYCVTGMGSSASICVITVTAEHLPAFYAYRPAQPLLTKLTENRKIPNRMRTCAAIFDFSSKSLDDCLAETFEIFDITAENYGSLTTSPECIVNQKLNN